MAVFEIARMHGMISSNYEEVECPPPYSSAQDSAKLLNKQKLSLANHLSSQPEYSLAFPSPRTWHAKRRSQVPSNASDESNSEGEIESESDEGAEMAEWMAQSCIVDDDVPESGKSSGVAARSEEKQAEDPTVVAAAVRSLVLDRLKFQHSGDAKSGTTSAPSYCRWGSNCSTDVSQGGSPTSVLGDASNEAWDLLFAAAGEIQRIARDQSPSNDKSSLQRQVAKLQKCPSSGDRNKGAAAAAQAASAAVPGGWGRQSQAAAVPRRGGRRDIAGIATPPRGHAAMSHSQHSSPSRASKLPSGSRGLGDGHLPMHLGGASSLVPSPMSSNSGASKDPQGPGTGVFLPRAAPPTPPAEQQSASVSPSKKAQRPTTVLLPARLVQALGLNVDGDNNVVFANRPHSRPGSPSPLHGGPSARGVVGSSGNSPMKMTIEGSNASPHRRSMGSGQAPRGRHSRRASFSDGAF